MGTRRRWIPAIIFAVLPCLPLWKTWLFGLTIGPFDQIRQMAPWFGPTPREPWDVLQVDGVLQFYPWRDLVLSSWAHLRPPYWNPYELAGTPLLANSQSGGFYPPHILLGALHIPTPVAVVMLAWFHLSLAGLGCFALARRLGGTSIGGYIAGVSFLLSPLMLSWTSLASVTSTVAWIPWAIFGVYGVFGETGIAPQGRQAIVVALSTAMMILAGHLQFAAYGILATAFAACGLLALAGGLRLQRASLCVSGLILGILIASVHLAPVLRFSSTSNRQNTASEEGYKAYVGSAVQPFELATLSNAVALGDPREPLDDQHQSLSTYWPVLVKRGANFAESAICLGPIVLAALVFLPFRDSRLWPLLCLAAFAILLGTGTFLNRVFYFGIPGWSASGSPGRVVSIFVLTCCTLAGASVRQKVVVGKRQWLLVGTVLLIGALLSWFGPLASPSTPASVAPTVDAMRSIAAVGSLPSLLIGLALAVGSIALVFGGKTPRWGIVAIAAPMLLCAASGGLSLVTTGSPLAPIEKPPSSARVAYINLNWGIVTPSRGDTPPNVAALSRVHELGGYDSLLNRDTVLLLKQIEGQDPAPPANGNMMFVKSADAGRLARAGVTYISEGGRLASLAGAPGRLTFTGDPAEIVEEDLTSIRVSASGAGTLVLRDRMMPGWNATVDGRSTPLQPGVWRELRITGAGPHQILFSYEPPGLQTGAWLALLGVAGLIALAILCRNPIPAEEKKGSPEEVVT